MTEEQIKEVMRLVDEIENLAWSAGKTEQYNDETTDYAERVPAARAELETYLRTIGTDPAQNTFPLNPNGASKWAYLQKHDGTKAIGVVFRTGSGSVGSLVDGRVVWADWLAHPNGSKPESANGELLDAAKIAVRDALDRVDVHPCDEGSDIVKARGLPDPMRELYLAVARAESAIETPAKVSPCAGHAAQLDADETTKRSSGLFKCWICLDTGFIPKAGGLPEPPDVKCPNGCKPKKGGAA